MGYVYKFVDYYNEIIYIGKTQNIQRRMKQHFKDGHLDKECYENVNRIFYIEVDGKTNMDMYESFLINKYVPKYNVDKQFKEILSLHNNDFLKYREVEWKELFLTFNNGEILISTSKQKPLYYDNNLLSNEKCKLLIDANIENLKNKKGLYLYYLKKEISDIYDFLDYLLILHLEIFQTNNIIGDCSDLDEPINEKNSYEYVAFNVNKIKNINLKYFLILQKTGLITRIDNDIYGLVVHNKHTLSFAANKLT